MIFIHRIMHSPDKYTANLIHAYFEKNRVSPPIVVGGLGGSGTRLVVKLLREMSVQMGKNVNQSEDARHFISLYDEFIIPYLLNGSFDEPIFQINLLSAIKAHRQHMPYENWGWKNPRSIYLLPMLDKLIPNLHYIHVIRHGFEMASSSNKIQLEKYQNYLLSAEQCTLPLELRALSLWQIVNQKAADYGLKQMGARYQLLRYEDVCTDPTQAMHSIAEQFSLKLPKNWKQQIVPPQARMQNIQSEFLGKMASIGAATLIRFGYSC
jgi:hypothetical protein